MHLGSQACKAICKAMNFCSAQILRFQELRWFTMRNLHHQYTEQVAVVYSRECVLVTKIAKFNLQRKFVTSSYSTQPKQVCRVEGLVSVLCALDDSHESDQCEVKPAEKHNFQR